MMRFSAAEGPEDHSGPSRHFSGQADCNAAGISFDYTERPDMPAGLLIRRSPCVEEAPAAVKKYMDRGSSQRSGK